MTEEQARTRAEQARPAHRVPEGWKLVRSEKRYVQLGIGKPEEPAPVRDLLAWVVRFSDGLVWAELALEDSTGQVVRAEYSR